MKKGKIFICLLQLANFLRQFSNSFSVQLNPKIGNPKNAYRNRRQNDDNPGNPDPPGDDGVGGSAEIKRRHPVDEIGASEATDEWVKRVEGRGEEIVEPGGEDDVVPAGGGEGPGVLAEAGDFGEDEEGEDGGGAVGDDVAAGEEDEEGGEVVADEEHVWGEEHEVVDEIGEEVSHAVVEYEVLEGRVWGGEPAPGRRVEDHGPGGEEHGGSAVGQGDQTARGFGSGLGAPVPEDDESGQEVDAYEHAEEERKMMMMMMMFGFHWMKPPLGGIGIFLFLFFFLALKEVKNRSDKLRVSRECSDQYEPDDGSNFDRTRQSWSGF